MAREKRTFSKEFKEEAVKLALAGDRSLKEIAESLGIKIWHLSGWKMEYLKSKGTVFKQGQRSPEEEKIARLERDIADLRMENAILKKATAIFSRQK
jgi:transposase